MTVITRFAPSPTGMLHIGNARTAIVNWLFARSNKGKFILRIDDTDNERSKEEYLQAIIKDLTWLGLKFDITFKQSERTARYNEVKEQLISSGRLYPCFETQEELDLKRKISSSQGKPFIYDRASLKLSEDHKKKLIESGVQPHYRFLLNHENIEWDDLIKGHIKYHGSNISDPVVIKPDGGITYLLCSVIDDIDYGITNIIRGEDHITNTAIQIQMFKAIDQGFTIKFGHLSLVKAKDDKISKRIGGYEIANMRDEMKLHPMAICSFLTFIGTSQPISQHSNLESLIKAFDISTYSKSPTTYIQEELFEINRKLITNLSFSEITPLLPLEIKDKITEDFWNKIHYNIKSIDDLEVWWKICYNTIGTPIKDDTIGGIPSSEVGKVFLESIPTSAISENTLNEWIDNILAKIDLKKKDIFPHIRQSTTSMLHGPELKNLLPLIGKEEIARRVKAYFAF